MKREQAWPMQPMWSVRRHRREAWLHWHGGAVVNASYLAELLSGEGAVRVPVADVVELLRVIEAGLRAGDAS